MTPDQYSIDLDEYGRFTITFISGLGRVEIKLTEDQAIQLCSDLTAAIEGEA